MGWLACCGRHETQPIEGYEGALKVFGVLITAYLEKESKMDRDGL